MTEDLFDGVAGEALAAAEEQQSTRAAQREAAALEVAEKAQLREEALDVFRVAVNDATEASALFDARRRDVYLEAYRLHEEHGVSWKDLAAVAGKTPEALIKGSNARTAYRPVTVEGLPQGWVLLTNSRGQGFGISVEGVEYRHASAAGLEKVMNKSSYHFSTLTMRASVTAERHNAAADQITLTDEHHAKLTKALTAIRTAAARRSRAADKRAQEAKAQKKRRR